MNIDERVATLETKVDNIEKDIDYIKTESDKNKDKIQSLVLSLEKLVDRVDNLVNSINEDRKERKERDNEIEARLKSYEDSSFWNKLKGLLSKSVGGALVTALSGGALFVIYKIYNLIFG